MPLFSCRPKASRWQYGMRYRAPQRCYRHSTCRSTDSVHWSSSPCTDGLFECWSAVAAASPKLVSVRRRAGFGGCAGAGRAGNAVYLLEAPIDDAFTCCRLLRSGLHGGFDLSSLEAHDISRRQGGILIIGVKRLGPSAAAMPLALARQPVRRRWPAASVASGSRAVPTQARSRCEGNCRRTTCYIRADADGRSPGYRCAGAHSPRRPPAVPSFSSSRLSPTAQAGRQGLKTHGQSKRRRVGQGSKLSPVAERIIRGSRSRPIFCLPVSSMLNLAAGCSGTWSSSARHRNSNPH